MPPTNSLKLVKLNVVVWSLTVPILLAVIFQSLVVLLARNVFVPARADKLSILVISMPIETSWLLPLIVTLSFRPPPPSMSPEI